VIRKEISCAVGATVGMNFGVFSGHKEEQTQCKICKKRGISGWPHHSFDLGLNPTVEWV
jgi:hypothetical protein